LFTLAELKEVLHYDRSTGTFIWNKGYGQRGNTGSIAGWPDNGYVRICIKGKSYLAHRLAWFYHYGIWPINLLDHINGNRNDNRIKNLRQCVMSENLVNAGLSIRNSSGHKGVDHHNGKWRARIKRNGISKLIGYFRTAEEAGNAYDKAASEIHGEFYYKLGVDA
jgi:hypothetical protein